MNEWFKSPETTPTHTVPCEALVRFVATNYKPPATFLDIGSGSGANTKWLESQGFVCVAIDPALAAVCHYNESAAEYLNQPDKPPFDCIFDINTLCHVENPPYEAIYVALKPGGKFFSIHPADDTQVDMAGKGYTRLADVLTMRQLLGRGFMQFTIHKGVEWDGDVKRTYWQIEATK